ncbi:MAG: hypothetical protein ACYDBA_04660 [Sulfuricaulis sp.]
MLFGMFSAKKTIGRRALFLATTVLMSVTGFFFPRNQLLPSYIAGIRSQVVLAVAMLALHVYNFAGVMQAFQKLSFLKRLAPTQSAAPFLIAQAVVLASFVMLGIVAVRLVRPETKGLTSIPA